MTNPIFFHSIEAVADYIRDKLNSKKFAVLFAYNGTGKTRLSMAYKQAGKKATLQPLVTNDGDTITTQAGDTILANVIQGDTLYFNAFTEDLFHWDNDIQNDEKRTLKINTASKFLHVLKDRAIDLENNYIGPSFQRYADLNFKIDYDSGNIVFEREIIDGETTKKVENIKISRGEESIFIWCFFLAVAQLAVDKHESYQWVKYIYVDDPVSSLDDNNVIVVACHLAAILKNKDNEIAAVISTHHSLFFDVVCNELKKRRLAMFLKWSSETQRYSLEDIDGLPFFQHVALLKELNDIAESGKLYTFHFNVLRSILERTASFHGYEGFSECIKQEGEDDALHARVLNLLSHGDYSVFEPIEMGDDNKKLFRQILRNFKNNYRFNPEIFQAQAVAEGTTT